MTEAKKKDELLKRLQKEQTKRNDLLIYRERLIKEVDKVNEKIKQKDAIISSLTNKLIGD